MYISYIDLYSVYHVWSCLKPTDPPTQKLGHWPFQASPRQPSVKIDRLWSKPRSAMMPQKGAATLVRTIWVDVSTATPPKVKPRSRCLEKMGKITAAWISSFMEFSLYQNEKKTFLLLYPFISYYLMILVSTCKSGRITRYYHLIVILYDQFCRSRATARSLAKLQCEQAARNQLAINPFHLSFKFPGEMLSTTPYKYIQMQSPCSASRFMHPIKPSFSLWAELQCSRKSSKPRQRTEVVSPVQDSSLRPVLEQRHWSEKPPKSAPFAKPQWSWVRPTTEKAILARLATCTGFKDLYNVEEQSLSQISSITNPRWGNSKTKVRKSNICTIKHKSM